MKFVLQLLGFNKASKFHNNFLVEFRGRPIIIGARGAYIWGDYKLRCFSCLQVDGRCPLTKGAYKGQFGAKVLTKS